MSRKLPHLSVVIPSWRGAGLLARTLPTVMAQDYPDFEILVVENGIADNTSEIVASLSRGFPQLRLLRLERNIGYAGAVNQGVRAASSRFVAVLCNDNECAKNWLSALMRTMLGAGTAKPVGAVMSRSSCPGLNTELRGNMNFALRNVSYPDPSIRDRPASIFYPGGNAFLLDKEACPEPFPERLFTYGEDLALGWRLRLKGYEVLYAHDSVVESFDGGTTKRTPFRTAYLTERNRLQNALTFYSWKSLVLLAPLLKLDAVLSILFGKNKRAKLLAWLNTVFLPHSWLKERASIQRERRADEKEILRAISPLFFSEPSAGLKALMNRCAKSYLRLCALRLGGDA